MQNVKDQNYLSKYQTNLSLYFSFCTPFVILGPLDYFSILAFFMVFSDFY